RLAIESVKERQESELINNKEYGLLAHAVKTQKIKTRTGAPTPDDLDELITRVWKEPAFFVAHPAAIAAFGRECTRRGVPPPTVTLFGSPFLTRTGEKKRGVIGLFHPGLPGEVSPSLSVRPMGINKRGAAEYLVSPYCS